MLQQVTFPMSFICGLVRVLQHCMKMCIRDSYGAGEKDYPHPNVLRAIMGKRESRLKEEKNLMIETNIDDMSPQVVEYLTEKLFQAGALDVFITPIFMKKQRPAFQLSVIAPPLSLIHI